MNREKLYKFVNLWMSAELATTEEEEDSFLDQLDPIWYEFTEEETALIRTYIQPFIHETKSKSTTGETNHD